MRYFLLTILAIVISTFAVAADNGKTTITITTTYYGEKANSNGSNPCFGNTTNVCGTKTVEIDQSVPEYIIVIEITRDAEGNQTGKTSTPTKATVDEIIADALQNVPENAVVEMTDAESQEQYAEPAP